MLVGGDCGPFRHSLLQKFQVMFEKITQNPALQHNLSQQYAMWFTPYIQIRVVMKKQAYNIVNISTDDL